MAALLVEALLCVSVAFIDGASTSLCVLCIAFWLATLRAVRGLWVTDIIICSWYCVVACDPARSSEIVVTERVSFQEGPAEGLRS